MNRRERLGATLPPQAKDLPVSLESVVAGEDALMGLSMEHRLRRLLHKKGLCQNSITGVNGISG